LLAIALTALLLTGPAAADIGNMEPVPISPYAHRTKLLYFVFHLDNSHFQYYQGWIDELPNVKDKIDGVVVMLFNFRDTAFLPDEDDIPAPGPATKYKWLHNPHYGQPNESPGFLDVCEEEGIPFYWGRRLWPHNACYETSAVFSCQPGYKDYISQQDVLTSDYYEDFLQQLDDERAWLEENWGLLPAGTCTDAEPQGDKDSVTGLSKSWLSRIFANSILTDCSLSPCIPGGQTQCCGGEDPEVNGPSDDFLAAMESAITTATGQAPMVDIAAPGGQTSACFYGWRTRLLGHQYFHYKTAYTNDIATLQYGSGQLAGEFKWDPPPCGHASLYGPEYDDREIQLDWAETHLKPSAPGYENENGFTVPEWATSTMWDFYCDLGTAFPEFDEGGIILHVGAGNNMTLVMQELAAQTLP